MSEWKCGNCGKVFTSDEFILLGKTVVVEKEADPAYGISPTDPNGHGYTSVCSCGYRFLIDRWRLHDDVEIKTDKGGINIRVSTIDLELNHGFEKGENIWYETKIFPGGLGNNKLEWLECYYENRYETQEEALKDHDRILNLLKEGKYNIEDSDEGKKELILESSDDI